MIRIARKGGIGGQYTHDTQRERQMLQSIVDSLNEQYGEGSAWIEKMT